MGEVSGSETFERSVTTSSESTWTRADAATLVADLGRRIGMPDLELDEERDAAWLMVDDEFGVSIVHQAHLPGLVVGVSLPVEVEEHPDLLRSLLQANLSWEQTGGGTFGALPGHEAPMLCQLVPFAVADAAVLERRISELVLLVRDWQDEGFGTRDRSDEADDGGERPAGSHRV